MGQLPQSPKSAWVLPDVPPEEIARWKLKLMEEMNKAAMIAHLNQGKRVPQKLSPARDWVILELEETKYTGSLVIPDTAKDAPQIGNVIAVGPGEWDFDQDAYVGLATNVGDRVMFTKYSGADVEWEGKSLLLIRESEIICYIKEG